MLSKIELGAYLKKVRKEKEISLREVYRCKGITFSHLSMIENGKRNSTPALLRNLAELYNLDYLDLYEKAGFIDLIEDNNKNKYKQDIPLLGVVKGGFDYLANENIIEYITADNIKNPENHYALTVKGDSMFPIMGDKDIVIVQKQEDFESGQTCIVIINGDEATVKDVYKTETGIILKPRNHYYSEQIYTFKEIETLPIQIIGVVVESRNRSGLK